MLAVLQTVVCDVVNLRLFTKNIDESYAGSKTKPDGIARGNAARGASDIR
jgi:hypothetical protein